MIDFSIQPELEEIRARITAFMDAHVYVNEDKVIEHEGLPARLERELQQKVKDEGLWAPNLPKEWGGMGIGYIGQALVNEIIGRSVIAPRIFGEAAPDFATSINWYSTWLKMLSGFAGLRSLAFGRDSLAACDQCR